MALVLLELDSEDLDLAGETLDLDCLEDDDELDVVAEVGFLVVGEVLDAGSIGFRG